MMEVIVAMLLLQAAAFSAWVRHDMKKLEEREQLDSRHFGGV